MASTESTALGGALGVRAHKNRQSRGFVDQEDADWRLALQLQRQFNDEEQQHINAAGPVFIDPGEGNHCAQAHYTGRAFSLSDAPTPVNIYARPTPGGRGGTLGAEFSIPLLPIIPPGIQPQHPEYTYTGYAEPFGSRPGQQAPPRRVQHRRGENLPLMSVATSTTPSDSRDCWCTVM